MFNFTDYLIYNPKASEHKASLAGIASGVIAYVQNVYAIKLDTTDSFAFTQTVAADVTEVYCNMFPTNDVVDVTDVDENLLAFTYNKATNIITLDEALDESQTLIITADYVYEEQNADIRLAMYRHIDSVLYSKEHSLDNIAKVQNSTGASTTFKSATVPKACTEVYNYYSPRQVILV